MAPRVWKIILISALVIWLGADRAMAQGHAGLDESVGSIPVVDPTAPEGPQVEQTETEERILGEEDRARELRALIAQEKMAEWAGWMFYSSLATISLTALALFTIFRTLLYTRRAAESADGMLREATAATEAAKATASATEQIGRLQLRAYVGVTSVTINYFREAGALCGDISVWVSNTGSTPATILFIGGSREIQRFGDERPGQSGGGGNANKNERILGPQSEFKHFMGFSGMQVYNDGTKLSAKIGVFLRYRDIYGEEHVEASWWHHRIMGIGMTEGQQKRVDLHPTTQVPKAIDGLSDDMWPTD